MESISHQEASLAHRNEHNGKGMFVRAAGSVPRNAQGLQERHNCLLMHVHIPRERTTGLV